MDQSPKPSSNVLGWIIGGAAAATVVYFVVTTKTSEQRLEAMRQRDPQKFNAILRDVWNESPDYIGGYLDVSPEAAQRWVREAKRR